MKYPVLLTPERTEFRATVLDLRGCTATGVNAWEALQAVSEAMRNYFSLLADSEATFPYPHSLQEAIQRPDIQAALNDGALLGMVGVSQKCGSVELPDKMFDAELLKAIDMDAERRHLSREEWLESAGLEKLTRGPK